MTPPDCATPGCSRPRRRCRTPGGVTRVAPATARRLVVPRSLAPAGRVPGAAAGPRPPTPRRPPGRPGCTAGRDRRPCWSATTAHAEPVEQPKPRRAPRVPTGRAPLRQCPVARRDRWPGAPVTVSSRRRAGAPRVLGALAGYIDFGRPPGQAGRGLVRRQRVQPAGDPEQVRPRQGRGRRAGPAALRHGPAAAARGRRGAAMTYNELYQVLSAGHSVEELNILDYNQEGTAMPEDGLFVSEAWLHAAPRNKDIAARFLRASFKGWAYCRDHAGACVDLVVENDAQGGDARAAQQWQMDEVNKLVWGDPIDTATTIGYLPPELFSAPLRPRCGSASSRSRPATPPTRTRSGSWPPEAAPTGGTVAVTGLPRAQGGDGDRRRPRRRRGVGDGLLVSKHRPVPPGARPLTLSPAPPPADDRRRAFNAPRRYRSRSRADRVTSGQPPERAGHPARRRRPAPRASPGPRPQQRRTTVGAQRLPAPARASAPAVRRSPVLRQANGLARGRRRARQPRRPLGPRPPRPVPRGPRAPRPPSSRPRTRGRWRGTQRGGPRPRCGRPVRGRRSPGRRARTPR